MTRGVSRAAVVSDTRAQWFALSSLYRQDPKIEALGERFGADGPYLVIGLMCEAAQQRRGGRVEGSLRQLAHDCFIAGRERAAEIITAADETDVIEIESLDSRAFVVRIANWTRWQERFRKAGGERSTPEGNGTARSSSEHTGTGRREADGAVARDKDRDKDKDNNSTEQELRSVPSSLQPYVQTLAVVVEGKEGARPLKVKAAVKACGDFADRNLAFEADKFRHYWLDGVGQNRKLKDIAGAWRNWLRNAPPANASRQPAGEHPADRRIRESLEEARG